MISYHDISTATFNALQFVSEGSGSGDDTHLNLNLSKAPWLIPFGGTTPDSATASGQSEGQAVAAELSQAVSGDILLTLTFDPPLASDPNTGVNVSFLYNSLS